MINLRPKFEPALPFGPRLEQAAQLGSLTFADLASGGSGYALDGHDAFQPWRL